MPQSNTGTEIKLGDNLFVMTAAGITVQGRVDKFLPPGDGADIDVTLLNPDGTDGLNQPCIGANCRHVSEGNLGVS